MNELDIENDLPEKIKPRWSIMRKSVLIPFGIAILYGIVMRLTFGSSAVLSTMTYGFLCFMPVALGAVTVYFGNRTFRLTWWQALVIAWLPGTFFLIGIAIMNFEFSLCLLMAAPIFYGASSVGGLVMNAILRLTEHSPRSKNSVPALLVAIMVVPYMVSGVENRTPPPDAYHIVDTQIIIDADAQTVWDHIVRVRHIRPEEQSTRLTHLMGVPQPVEALLDFDGLGGVRYASYDNGLTFVERITEWKPLDVLSFNIKVDRREFVPAPFNALGGQFEVLDGTYRIETLPDGRILLHLSSTQRLSTQINGYGRLWTEYIMADLQNYILEIIKVRCEAL
ncbi:MAG: hypothetical protein H7X77_05870 [Anaerolineae bacterium]|nr:hypothetical protein [Anaerolineae bacterium]